MDGMNMRNIERMTGHTQTEGKIFKMLSFAGLSRDVSDPWYTDDFDQAYRDIELGCRGFLKYLEESGRI